MVRTKLIILIIVWSGITQHSIGQNQNSDTIFLLKGNGHSIFIDHSPTSTFYDSISNFNFSELDKDNFDYTLRYLQKKGKQLFRTDIMDIPKEWIILKYYQNNYYTYCPSDFYNHYKISISDTAFIDYGGEGPVANRINSFKKKNDDTFVFSLTGLAIPKRDLTITIIDREKGIAVFKSITDHNEIQLYLMIDAAKIRQLPIIVNNSKDQKQLEFEFGEPNFKRLLRGK